MTTNNPTSGEGGAPELNEHDRYIREAIEMLPNGLLTADLIRAVAKGLRQRDDCATQPATAPSDERFMVHEPTGTVECNDSRCPVGATIIGWPHPLNTPTCIYAATAATPTDVAERARRAADRIYNKLPGHIARHVNKGLLADIIAAEFGGETK